MITRQKEAVEPTSADELKARAIYDSGKALFRLGAYKDAAIQFERLILEYPATNYAEASVLMLEACKNIQYLTERSNAKPESKKSGSSSFITGMLGGCVGVGLVILILAQALD
jgi:TolA-binding protein